jgi:beta-glucosidase
MKGHRLHLPACGSLSRRLALLLVIPLLVLASAACTQTGYSGAASHGNLPYQNPSLPVPKRVDDLLSRMTLAEKVGQLAQVNVGTGLDYDQVFSHDHVGSVLSGGGEVPSRTNNPRAWADGIDKIQKAALERSRLGIPILYGADAPHGLSPVLGSIIFPQQIGMGATHDPALARRVAAVTSRGAKAVGIRWIFGPIADVSRDLRWGRYYETFSEDPALASAMVAATVRGLQGTNPNHLAVAATAKHFIGYSQPRGGMDAAPARISNAALKKWFEPPFRAAIDAGVAAVMNQHSMLNGQMVVGSHPLLTTLLRDQMRFKGVEITDWGDIENLVGMCNGSPNLVDLPTPASSYKDAVRMGIDAGVDVSMIPDDSTSFTANLKALVRSGEVPEKRLDQAVRRVLTLKFRLGLFEHPYVDASKAEALVTEKSDRKLARRAVDESLTLLKNDHHVLPLNKKGGPILVVGPAANSVSWQMGGWTIDWQGIPSYEKPPAVTILQGIRDAIGSRNVLTANWTSRADLRAKAKKARAIVVAIGEAPYAEWEGDNSDGSLGTGQPRLVNEAEATGKPVVLVLVAGRPLMITGLIENADAFLMAYLPGSEGGDGVADVLFGRVSPHGRLPVSWPASLGDVPMVKGVRLSEGKKVKPLFAYGAGLSY